MKIFLHEIPAEGTELDFDQSEDWLEQAVLKVDEKDAETEAKQAALEAALARPATATASAPKAEANNGAERRPVHASFTLSRVDEVVVVNGSIETSVELICSRCAKFFRQPMKARFSALFCQDPEMAGVGHLRAEGKPAGQIGGYARHEHAPDASEENDPTGLSRDIDITYLSDDFVELGDVVTEQLQLQVPFQPLCAETCKGLCSNCGTDQNQGRCACARLQKESPFAALAGLKF